MVGWDTVTDIYRDKGRFSGEPSFVFLGARRVQQSATAVCAAIRKSDVMRQASQWPRLRHAHSSILPYSTMSPVHPRTGHQKVHGAGQLRASSVHSIILLDNLVGAGNERWRHFKSVSTRASLGILQQVT
jgi:hypothetical protein